MKTFDWLRYATLLSVPAVLISTPLSVKLPVALSVEPWIVPEAVISSAPVISPVFVMPPEWLSMPLVTLKPLDAVRRPSLVIVPPFVVEILPPFRMKT